MIGLPQQPHLMPVTSNPLGNPIVAALGSPPPSIINLEASLPGSSQTNTTSAVELSMEDYGEPTEDWSLPVLEEPVKKETTWEELVQEEPVLEETMKEAMAQEELTLEETAQEETAPEATA
jgi:hypothetical protein